MEEKEKEQEDLVTSTVRPEEIPPIPENRFLMRRSPQTTQTSNKEEKDQRNKDDRPRQKLVFFKQRVMKYCLHELICMSLLSSFAAPVHHIILCQHIRNGLW